MPPLSSADTRALLERLRRRPIRKLGQNFLIDGNIVRKSLAMAEVAPGDAVVEIGPGLGTLTEALLDAGASVWAVERDPVLAAHIRKMETLSEGRLHLVEGDALEWPLAGLTEARQADFKIVANLPYAISTPWMDAVLCGSLPSRMTLMLQKEAARRYAASPGSKQFGAISLFLQAAYRLAGSHDVSPACFYPRPEVGSRLLRLDLKPAPHRFPPECKGLIRELFRQRRKQFGSLLRQSQRPLAAAWLKRLEPLGIPPRDRPEQIPLERWQALAGGQREGKRER